MIVVRHQTVGVADPAVTGNDLRERVKKNLIRLVPPLPRRTVEVPGPRAKFSQLLHLTAEIYGVSERDLVKAGRQRQWVRARSMLVYLAREWARTRVKEIGRRLHRDPSIISRLYLAYAADRDQNKEKKLGKQLRQYSSMKA
jgi:chromosomal replication initiation ATPase DnaA